MKSKKWIVMTMVLFVVVVLCVTWIFKMGEKSTSEKTKELLKDYAVNNLDEDSEIMDFYESKEYGEEFSTYNLNMKTSNGASYSVYVFTKNVRKDGSFDAKSVDTDFVVKYGDYLFQQEDFYKALFQKKRDAYVYHNLFDENTINEIIENAKNEGVTQKEYMDENKHAIIKENYQLEYQVDVQQPVEKTPNMDQHYDEYVVFAKAVEGYSYFITLEESVHAESDDEKNFVYSIERDQIMSKEDFQKLFLEFNSRKE